MEEMLSINIDAVLARMTPATLALSTSLSSTRQTLTPPPRPAKDFQPSINQRSVALAQRQGTTQERLLTAKQPAPAAEYPFSHNPQTNKRSAQLDKYGQKAAGERWERLYQIGLRSNDKVRQRELDEKELAECTFKPNVLNAIPASKVSIEQRSLLWATMKQQKIEETKAQEADKDLVGCTFAPTIQQYARKHHAAPIQEQRGVAQFLKRHQAARKHKQPQEVPEESVSTRDLSETQFNQARHDLHQLLLQLK